MKRAIALSLLLVVLVGCSKWSGNKTNPKPSDQGAPAQAPAGPPGEQLLPAEGIQYSYSLSDGTFSDEFFVRDGNRLIGSYNGSVYLTWFVTDQGIWRNDPKGSVPLRYLPPTLRDQLSWKQTSGGEEVWFRLQERKQCDHPEGKPVKGCWELMVLNRMERTLFRFAVSDGIIQVDSEDLASPKESYVKRRRVTSPVPPPKREVMVKGGKELPSGPLPNITEVTPAQFDDALARMNTRSGH